MNLTVAARPALVVISEATLDPFSESAEELSPRDGYAAWASCYEDDGNPLIPLEGPAVAALFGPVAGKRVLDLGCGTGRHTLALAQAGAQVTALDQSPEMMAVAHHKLQGYPVEWLIHSLPVPLPLPDETFALVVAGLVVEHVADVPMLFREAVRVLCPGGRFVLSALHPDRTAAGQRARFIDPETGIRLPITTYHRSTADYLRAATQAGLTLVSEQTLVMTADVAALLPRAQRYVGLALGWVAGWDKAPV
jgi:malonyl-CoA O-methyltransferase